MASSERKTVPVTYVRLLFEYLDERGLDAEAVLGRRGPEPDAGGPDGISIGAWTDMLVRAAHYLDDPLLGLHLGQTITTGHLGVLGHLLLACENFGAALDRLDRYQRLIYDVASFERRSGPGWIDLVWDFSEFRPHRLVDESGVASLIQMSRNLVRHPFSPLAIGFTHPVSPHAEAFVRYCGCPVHFDQPEPWVRIATDSLALPLTTADPALIRVLEQHADQLIAALPGEDALIQRVRREIAHLVRDGEADIEQVSQRLCCSSRTLQRRLKASGTGFRDLVNEVRRQFADAYLGDPRLNIVDIAMLLGYSEHSAFTRAYKHWTGRTPQQELERRAAPAEHG